MNQSTNSVGDTANGSAVENAKVGYQAAITLWAYEGTTIWAKFTAMVALFVAQGGGRLVTFRS